MLRKNAILLILLGFVAAANLTWWYLPKNENVSGSVASVAAGYEVDAKSPAKDEQSVKPDTYQVTRVIDGDTFEIMTERGKQKVRALGINTPETVDPRRGVQCFGLEASAKAKGLLTGDEVTLEFDSSQGRLDKYGRLLSYVYLPDGTSFNEKMILDGYAYEYTYDIPYRYQSRYKEAEGEAKTEKRGLWADEACGGKT